MRRALELARRGWGRVAPNPLVGAVMVRDGRVLGEGWHAEFGGPHAEVAALEAAGDARGATCVVTLEPCAHHGKTPPCTDALIEAGVARVVAAIADPYAEARGGAVQLRDAGLEVELGLEAQAAAALNAPFLWSIARPERPFVAVKVATSLDGFLADAAGRSQWISGRESRAYVHWLRAGFDAIGVGRVTADVDDPELTARGTVVPRIPPTRVVFAGRGGVRPDLRVVRTAHAVPTVVLAEPGPATHFAAPLEAAGVRVLRANDLSSALRTLREADVRSVLIEGGGRLVSSLLDAELVDRLYWIQAPVRLGQGQPAFLPAGPIALGEAPRWTVTERRALGEDTLLVVDRELCLQAS